MAVNECFQVYSMGGTTTSMPIPASFPRCTAILKTGAYCNSLGQNDAIAPCLCNHVSSKEVDGCLNEWRNCTGSSEDVANDVRAALSQWSSLCDDDDEDLPSSPETGVTADATTDTYTSPQSPVAAAAITTAVAPFRVSNSSTTSRSSQHGVTPPPSMPAHPSKTPSMAAPRLQSVGGIWSYFLLFGAAASTAHLL